MTYQIKLTDHLEATRNRSFRITKLGSLKLEEIVGVMDSISAIYIVCARVLQNLDVYRNRWEDKCEPLRQSSKFSLAKSMRVLRVWDKWTHQFHGSTMPDAWAVTSFLNEIA